MLGSEDAPLTLICVISESQQDVYLLFRPLEGHNVTRASTSSLV
jgi:hypothetical protein